MSTIKIKRSPTTGSPSALAQGELAYSYLSGTLANGGDRLYIGTGVETGGQAANIEVIGGKYFTEMLDHTPGTIVANSAIIVDNNGKIDELNIDNLNIDGNTIRSTNLNGDIIIDPDGIGQVLIQGPVQFANTVSISGDVTFDSVSALNLMQGRVLVAGLDGQIIDFNGLRYNTSQFTVIANTAITGDLSVTGNTTSANIIASNLTPGRIVLSDIGGRLTDSPLATFTPGEFNISANTTVTGGLTTTGNVFFESFNTGRFIVVGANGQLEDTTLISLNADTLALNSNTSVTGNFIVSGGNVSVPNLTVTSFATGRFMTVTTGGQIVDTTLIELAAGELNLRAPTVIDGNVSISTGNRLTTESLAVTGLSPNVILVADGSGNITTLTPGAPLNVNSTTNFSNTVNSTATTNLFDLNISGVANFDGTTDLGNIRIVNNTISAQNTNGDINLRPKGIGNVVLNDSKITGVANPVSNTDVVTLGYLENNFSSVLSFTGDTGTDDINLSTEILSLLGGTGITSTVTNNQVIFDLSNSGVIAGSYGSATQIPTITVDTQGRITNVTENSISSDLSFAGDTGADNVSLNGGTLTFRGGTGVSTTVTNDEITFAIGQDVSTTSGVTFAGGQFTGNVVIDGNLIVNGNSASINVDSINVEDPFVYLAAGNPGDTVDLGVMAEYNAASTSKFAGIFRDATNEEWYFFDNYEPVSTADNVIDRADPTFRLSTVNMNRLRLPGFNINLTGDVNGTVALSLLGGTDINISTSIQPDSVALGTDTTGDYVQSVSVTPGTGLILTGSGEGATVNIAGINASTSNKGVAQFNGTNFDVINGEVSIDTIDGGTY